MDAKSISKRIKLKGLQRLRWYCQMCEKQCRDENGFKNHCTTDNHLRQMEQYSSNTKQYVEDFSRQFEREFMQCLSRHHTKRVGANYVYNEMIQNKAHVHMNSTRWDSLGSFVRYLGETGKCEVDLDADEDKWYIRWIDPELEARKRAEERRGLDQAKRQKRMDLSLATQVLEMQEMAKEEEEENEADLALGETSSRLVTQAEQKRRALDIFREEAAQEDGKSAPQQQQPAPETVASKEKGWLMPELVVRIASKRVGGSKLVDEKAVVADAWEEGTLGDLIVLKTGEEILNVDYKRLETVVPKPSSSSKNSVVVCNPQSAIRGSSGQVVQVNMEDNTCDVQFENGNVVRFNMEEVCKKFEA